MWNHKKTKKKANFIETENRIVVSRSWRKEKWGNVSQRVQIFNCKNESEGCDVQHDDYN